MPVHLPSFLSLLFFLLLLTNALSGQHNEVTEADSRKFLDRLSVQISVANRPQSLRTIYDYQFNNFTAFSLGELALHYRLNDNLALGAGSIGSLGNCFSGYLEPGAEFRYFHLDPTGKCRSRNLSSLLLMLTTVPDELPVYVQFAVGHSYFDHAPAYALTFGFRQRLLPDTYLTLSLRETEVLHRYPEAATAINLSDGLRFELGVSWFR